MVYRSINEADVAVVAFFIYCVFFNCCQQFVIFHPCFHFLEKFVLKHSDILRTFPAGLKVI